MFYISGFYKFKKITNIKKNKRILESYFFKNSIRGTLILSSEGVNATLSSKKKNLYLILNKIKKIFKINNFDSQNLSKCKFQPFHRGKVKIKKEVVPMGIKIVKRNLKNHLNPAKWNKLIKNKNTLLIDARKPFENKVGSFKKSVNPQVNNFREFPEYLKKLSKDKTIAMFCTGGIRCEKAGIYLNKKGFKNVYQLNGGIINYLKKIKKSKSLWKGECYVFDNRISVKHGLFPGSFSMCSGCRKPISKKDKKSKKYEEGVSCPNCHDILTNSQKERFRMRQKQINLAKKQGKSHIFQKEF
tara:strand:- start:1900 stop:2799 length:900 start_codon:yes stop_codon:yes gene_type:complete